jgi:tetratricopeptide (TPR) repeat protein
LYDKVLAWSPNNTLVLANKGGALASLGKYQGAMMYIYKALALDPSSLMELMNKAGVLYYMDQNQEALTWIDKALELDVNNTRILEIKMTIQESMK